MIVVLSISILCLLLTFLEKMHVLKHGMFYGFVGITILYCIHYDFGTDYMTYLSDYQRNAMLSYTLSDFVDSENWHNGEYGWGFLNWLFSKISERYGFFLLVAFNSVIENIIIYRFIRKFIDLKDRGLSVFVYLFTSSFFLLGFSMMRQWLAMCLFLLAFEFISRKRLVWSLLIIYLATTIHHTAIILLPFAFAGYLPMRLSKVYGFVFLISFTLLMVEGEILNMLLGVFMTQSETVEGYVTNYSHYNVTNTFGLGFLLNIIPFGLSVYYLLTSKDSERLLMVFISCIGTMVIPFSQSLPMVKRISLYFSLLSIGTMPIVYSVLNNKLIKYLLIGVFIFMQFVGYFGFFDDPSYKIPYSQFHTIFSQF